MEHQNHWPQMLTTRMFAMSDRTGDPGLRVEQK